MWRVKLLQTKLNRGRKLLKQMESVRNFVPLFVSNSQQNSPPQNLIEQWVNPTPIDL